MGLFAVFKKSIQTSAFFTCFFLSGSLGMWCIISGTTLQEEGDTLDRCPSQGHIKTNSYFYPHLGTILEFPIKSTSLDQTEMKTFRTKAQQFQLQKVFFVFVLEISQQYYLVPVQKQ